MTVSTSEYVRRAAAGDTQAYDVLIGRYRNLVFAVALDRLRNAEDARDVAQETFIQAFVRLRQLRDPERFGPWLRQIAANECLSWMRRRRATETLVVEGLWVEDATRLSDNRIVVAQALARLDEPERLTVTMFYLQSYSMLEIGRFLDEPVTTIKSRLRNARVRLRKELQTMLEENLESVVLPEAFATQVTAVIEAASAGDAAKLEELLRSDRRLAGAATEGKTTALHVAANAGNLAIVELLLANGADPNAHDVSDAASPLYYASERGFLDVVRRLVAAGSDVNWTQDLHERGPLGWATVFERVQTEVADFLIASGARYDIFSAIALDRVSVVEELIAGDPAVVNARMSAFDGRQSPIVFAMRKRRVRLAELLVERGATVGLLEAAALGQVEVVRELVSATNEAGNLEATLRVAVECEQVEAARVLLEYGVDADAVEDGRNTLFTAIGTGNEEMARLLIGQGANLEFQDSRWNSTPLGWQVFFGKVENTRLGLELGAKVDPAWVGLTAAGERGELRSWSYGTPEGFRTVAGLLREASGG